MNTPIQQPAPRKQVYYDLAFQTCMQKITRMKIEGIITNVENREMIQQLLVEYLNIVKKNLNQK